MSIKKMSVTKYHDNVFGWYYIITTCNVTSTTFEEPRPHTRVWRHQMKPVEQETTKLDWNPHKEDTIQKTFWQGWEEQRDITLKFPAIQEKQQPRGKHSQLKVSVCNYAQTKK